MIFTDSLPREQIFHKQFYSFLLIVRAALDFWVILMWLIENIKLNILTFYKNTMQCNWKKKMHYLTLIYIQYSYWLWTVYLLRHFNLPYKLTHSEYEIICNCIKTSKFCEFVISLNKVILSRISFIFKQLKQSSIWQIFISK